ncbi:copper-binding protein [Amycolatopsis acidicola]|uniref:Copper-binding protein n=1 Tax=Amycolatopsis acidicola TaxID=2596893 RepID=A0A5N0VKD2_9PSEU|nr:cupredoxin family copper-binding protein [Amycolatopsis acidicola]KAA9166847.1 copper-binding protein [Amycolatopsis acidicola]
MKLLLVAALTFFGAFALAPPAQAATQAVMMEDYAYSPSTLTVHIGDTVTWTNHDQAPHDVTTTSAPVAIKSPMLSTGQSFSYTFKTAGTYSYYCSIHPDMKAQVTVLPAATSAPAVPSAPKVTTQPKQTTAPRSSSAQQQVPVAQQPTSSMSMPAATPTEQQAAPSTGGEVVQASATPTTTTTLDPKLIVAGVAAAIAVLCLLLLGSRREN